MNIYKYFILVFAVTILISCNNEQKKQYLQEIENKRTQYFDSLRFANALRDSLSQYAYSNAKFGMTLDEIKELDISPKFWGIDTNLRWFHDQIKNKWFLIEFHIEEDILYKVVISTEYYSATEIDGILMRDANLLRYAFEEKYGEFFTWDSSPSIKDLKSSKRVRMYYQKYGDKQMSISMQRKRSQPEYRVIAEVYSEKLNSAVLEKKERNREESFNPL